MPMRSPASGETAPKGGIICTVGHVGSNDAIGAAIAHLGLPLNAVADDSSFPELFDLLKRQREQWSATIIPWRNLRAIFGALRRRELLALLVDWGYRSDGIPVTLFGAWTTLPAGPATLAAKTDSRIVPIITTRQPDGRLHVGWADPIDVPSTDPADLQRATQRIADALAQTIAPAPHEWYSFKPMWPATAEEAADLERRARDDAGRPPGPGSGHGPSARPGRPDACGRSAGRGRMSVGLVSRLRGRALMAASWLACRLPEGLTFRVAELAGDLWYRMAPDRAAQARRNLRRVCEALAADGRGTPLVRAAATDPRALERLVRSAFRHNARYYLEVARTPAVTRAWMDERLALDTPELIAEAVVPGKAVLFVGLHFGSVELPVLFLAFRVGGQR